MRNAFLAGGFALISLLIVPACVETATADEAGAGSAEDALLEPEADEALEADKAPDGDVPGQLYARRQRAPRAAAPSGGPASLSSSSTAATLDDAEIDEDGDASAVSGSGDGRVIVKK
jgi:hypothetical protein